MANLLSGREALHVIDDAITGLRRQVSDAMEAAEDAEKRQAEIRNEQVARYKELAQLRLAHLANGPDINSLEFSEQTAMKLLSEHDDYVTEKQQKLQGAAEGIRDLEIQRETIAQELDEAVATYEGLVETIASELKKDDDYKALQKNFEHAEAVAERAHSKLAIAEENRVIKGQPYEKDPLFSYLWSRNFRTPRYESGLITRFFDNWVAGLCSYDAARVNYQRLTSLPLRLAEHAAQKDKEAETAEDALEAAEQAAMEQGGAFQLQSKANELRDGVEGLDHLIEEAEIQYQDIAAEHERALQLESGPANKARMALEDALKRSTFPDLRILAAQTLDFADDDIVDQLVKLRAEDMELEMNSEEMSKRPAARRSDLSLIEDFRRAFKSSRFDSPYAVFRESALDSAVQGLLRRSQSIEQSLRFLQKSMRQKKTRVDPGFGGSPRSETLGLPGVLGDIAIEIAKEAMRSGGRYGGYSGRRHSPFPSRPTRRRLPTSGFPGSSGRRGGFKLPRRGGKGGGFRTGGGF